MKKQTKTAKRQTLYKIISLDSESIHGGSARWHLPVGNKPGKWMPRVKPVLCSSGYHLVPMKGLYTWVSCRDYPVAIYLAEGGGKCSDEVGASDGKVAFATARLLKYVGVVPTNFRLFGLERREASREVLRVAKANAYMKNDLDRFFEDRSQYDFSFGEVEVVRDYLIGWAESWAHNNGVRDVSAFIAAFKQDSRFNPHGG